MPMNAPWFVPRAVQRAATRSRSPIRFLDLESEVGEGPAETAYELLRAGVAVKRGPQPARPSDEVGDQQLGSQLEPSPAPHLVEQASRELLVLAKRHAATSTGRGEWKPLRRVRSRSGFAQDATSL
jgi:hypothetical protein